MILVCLTRKQKKSIFDEKDENFVDAQDGMKIQKVFFIYFTTSIYTACFFLSRNCAYHINMIHK